MVRLGWKRSESVRRGSSIGHECWNMHPEPGVAHHHSFTSSIYVTHHSIPQWDVLLRCWHRWKNVQNIGLLITNEIWLVGNKVGPTCEVVISQTQYIYRRKARSRLV